MRSILNLNVDMKHFLHFRTKWFQLGSPQHILKSFIFLLLRVWSQVWGYWVVVYDWAVIGRAGQDNAGERYRYVQHFKLYTRPSSPQKGEKDIKTLQFDILWPVCLSLCYLPPQEPAQVWSAAAFVELKRSSVQDDSDHLSVAGPEKTVNYGLIFSFLLTFRCWGGWKYLQAGFSLLHRPWKWDP